MSKSRPWVAFNPQVWHYEQARAEVQKLSALPDPLPWLGGNRRGDGVGRAPITPSLSTVPEINHDAIFLYGTAKLDEGDREGASSTPTADTGTTVDSRLTFPVVVPSGETVQCNIWESITLAVEELFNSVQTLLNAQGVHSWRGGLAKTYKKWCKNVGLEANACLKSVLGDLAVVRNNLCVHRKPRGIYPDEKASFEETLTGFRIFRPGGTPIDVGAGKVIEFSETVREIWLDVLGSECGGRNKIPPERRKLFEGNSC